MPVKRRIAKMAGGAIGGASCPPGVWCMDTGMVVISVLVLGLIVALVFVLTRKDTAAIAALQKKPTVVVVKQDIPQIPAQLPSADPRFNPLSPEQSYNTPADIRGFPSPPVVAGGGAIPINQMTRPPGYPDTYQQVGVLTAPGGSETSASPTRTILPLFGRKLATNRDRWNYYTRTDGINPVQVPVQYKRRNCDDDNGCDEISSGDSISVPILGQSYVANVYRYSTPRYIPFG